MGRILAASLCCAVACYTPPHPDCGFVCGVGGACPDEYTCASDHFCHHDGAPTSTRCGIDAAVFPDSRFSDADLSPPMVIVAMPSDHAINVSRSVSINAVFSQSVSNTTVSTFIVSDGVAPYPGTVFYDAPAMTARFQPSPPLPPGKLITVQLTSGIVNILLVSLAPYSWQFATIDDVPPTVSSTSPMDTDTSVDPATSIVVVFSEAVTGVTTTSFAVDSGGAIAGTIVASAGNTTYTFTPTSPLPAASPVTVSLSSAIVDGATNALVPVMFSFTTQ